jgi:Flp pilus assembly protein TadD
MAELTLVNLLSEHVPGRYTFHDLLRAYATEQAHTHDSADDNRAATHRLLDHYLHTACIADRRLDPHRDPITISAPHPGVTPEHPADYQQAMTWFSTEHPVLLAAVDHAAATGFDTHVWQLAWSLVVFLDRRGHWHDWMATQQAALAATRRLADLPPQAYAHRFLANACTRLGRFDEARTRLKLALDLFCEAGDQVGQAHVHQSLSLLAGRQGRRADGLDHARQSLGLFQAVGHLRGQANALNSIGWDRAHLGDHEQALASCQQALGLFQQLGDSRGEAHAWDSVGYAHHHLGDHPQAVICYQHALDLYRKVDDRYYEAKTLSHLGDTHHSAGDTNAARDTWHHALRILNDLDNADADNVRMKLHHLDQPTAPTHTT